MSYDNLKDLPEEVKAVIFTPEHSLLNNEIANKFYLDNDQVDFILSLETDIFLLKVDPISLPKRLEGMEGAKLMDLRALALEIAFKVLWPLQEHLKTVDRLILRLGGKVPKMKHLRRKAYQKKIFPGQATGTVEKFIKEYDDFKELRLTAKKITNKRGRKVAPMVDNWINDYIHFLGAEYHSSLERARYFSKNPNVLALSEPEKRSLRFFITSYDDKVDMDFSVSNGILVVSEPSKEDKKAKDAISVDNILHQLHNQIFAIEKKVLPDEFIISEAGNEVNKIREVLWQAVGVQDKDKVISCLKVLVTKKALDLMLEEDNRFKNILKRFVSLKYGEDLDKWVDKNTDKLIARRLFLEMVLVDKMRLEDQEAMTIAFYLTNLLPESGQIVYLDTNTGKLRWREVQVVKDQITWVTQINI